MERPRVGITMVMTSRIGRGEKLPWDSVAGWLFIMDQQNIIIRISNPAPSIQIGKGRDALGDDGAGARIGKGLDDLGLERRSTQVERICFPAEHLGNDLQARQ